MRTLRSWLILGVVILAGAGGYLAAHLEFGGRDLRWEVAGGDPGQGREAIRARGCYACHVVSGIGKATGRVGPKLEEIHRQIYLAGVLPNSPENMILWIQSPQKFSPGTAMPDLGVAEQEARHMAAYLFGNP